MAVQVQYRYGTTTQLSSFAGGPQEIAVDTTKNTLVVCDGTQNGGYPLAKENLSNVPNFGGATLSTAGTPGKIPTPAAGDHEKVLYGDGTWKSLPTLSIIAYSGTAVTLALTDSENYLRFTNVSPKTLTVPSNLDVAFPIGTVISGVSTTTGALTIVAASGVTVNTPETLVLESKAFAAFVLTKVDTNTWDLAGNLVAA